MPRRQSRPMCRYVHLACKSVSRWAVRSNPILEQSMGRTKEREFFCPDPSHILHGSKPFSISRLYQKATRVCIDTMLCTSSIFSFKSRSGGRSQKPWPGCVTVVSGGSNIPKASDQLAPSSRTGQWQ